jgi:hypothetical protein
VDTVAVPKSRRLNLLEGMTLTAIFQAVPNFAGAVLLLKLMGSREIVGKPGGAAIFVVVTALIHAVSITYLAPKFPRFFRNSYEPLFFDATLSFSEKLLRWRTQPATSLQLVTIVMMLSLLAVGVASLG